MLCCLGENSSESERKNRTDALMIGLEGSGKTLLCRRLQGLYQETSTSEGEDESFDCYTVTTNGIVMAECPCPKGGALKSITIREVGGQMFPLWPQYYEDCNCVIFVMDSSDQSMIADATLELLDALKDHRLAGKPAALVLSKQDRPLVASRSEIEFVLPLDSLERTLDFTVFELSSIPDAKGTESEIGRKRKEGSVISSVDESQSSTGVESLFAWLLKVRQSLA